MENTYILSSGTVIFRKILLSSAPTAKSSLKTVALASIHPNDIKRNNSSKQ